MEKVRRDHEHGAGSCILGLPRQLDSLLRGCRSCSCHHGNLPGHLTDDDLYDTLLLIGVQIAELARCSAWYDAVHVREHVAHQCPQSWLINTFIAGERSDQRWEHTVQAEMLVLHKRLLFCT